MKNTLGKGTFYLMISQAAAILSNYIIHIIIAKHFGVNTYGVFGVVMSMYLINRSILNTGIPRATSKFISEDKINSKSILKASSKVQLGLALIMATIYGLFSKQLANLLGDPNLAPYIIFLGIISIFMPFLTLYIAYMNGLKKFREQAIIKTAFPILKLILASIFIYLGFEIYGVLAGYLIAIIISVFLCTKFQDYSIKSEENVQISKIIQFSTPLIIIAISTALTRNVSVLMIKSILEDNFTSGLYTSATVLANFPYNIFLALPMALLPVISQSASSNNLKLMRKQMKQALRYLILFMMPLAAIVTATSTELLSLIYTSKFSAASATLNILIWNSTILAMLTTLGVIIAANNKPSRYMIFILISLAALIIGNLYFVPLLGIKGAAISAILSSTLGCTLAGVYVKKIYGPFLDLHSFLKITLGSMTVLVIAHLWHLPGIYLLVSYGLLMLIYASILIIIKEIKKEDILMIKKVLTPSQ